MPFDHLLPPQRRMVPFAALMIAGCHPTHSPSSVDMAALRRVELADFQSLRLPASLLNAPTTTSDLCLDEHGAEPSLEYNAVMLQPWTRVTMRIGLYHPMRGWRLPGKPATHVDAALEARLEGASTTAILKLSSPEGKRQAHERLRQARARPVTELTCLRRYRLSVTTYSEGIAFIDRNYSCGGLCGEGATLAMEYRDKQWRLIAIRPSWTA